MRERMYVPEPGQPFEEVPDNKKQYFKEIPGEEAFVRKSAIEDPEAAMEDSVKIKEVKTVGMEWQPGSTEVTQNTSKPWVFNDHQAAANRGGREVAGGFGTYVMAFPGHFILTVEVDGEEYDIWTERDFKLATGVIRMTKKIRDIIASQMPKDIKVEERMGQKGTKYYKVTEDDILKWSDGVHEELVKQGVHQKESRTRYDSYEEGRRPNYGRDEDWEKERNDD